MARKRDIARVIAARYLSRAGSEAAFFVGVWGKAAYDLHATSSQIAALMLVLSVVSIVGSVFGGVLVDRYGPRRVLIGAEVLFVPASLSVALAHDLGSLTALVALWGLAGAPVMTSGASFAPFLAEDDEGDLRTMNSWIESAGSAAFITGPALGSLIVHYANVDWVFFIDAATSLIAAALVARTTLAHRKRQRDRGTAFTEFRDGVSAAYSTRSLRFYVLGGSVVWLGFGAFSALEPLFYRDVVKTGVEAIGYMNSIFGVGILAGALLLQRLPKKIVSARGLCVTVVLTGLGAVAYVGTADIRAIALGAALWGIAIGVMEPLLRTLLHRDSPANMVGRITGTAQVHRQAGELLPLAFAPTLAALFGVQATLVGGGVIVAVVAFFALFEASAIDRSTRISPPAEVEMARLSATDEPISPNQ
ncbi:MAG: MFS transporter [Actinomycetia bacterium]|nr:MFS transporter [Actinomycetes bacterium]